jgi:hypothetical protein
MWKNHSFSHISTGIFPGLIQIGIDPFTAAIGGDTLLAS